MVRSRVSEWTSRVWVVTAAGSLFPLGTLQTRPVPICIWGSVGTSVYRNTTMIPTPTPRTYAFHGPHNAIRLEFLGIHLPTGEMRGS